MKNVIYAVIAIAVLFVGYKVYSGMSVSEAVSEAVEATGADAVVETVGDAATTVADGASDAVEAVAEGATDAVEATTEAVEATTEAAADPLSVAGFDLNSVSEMIEGSEMNSMGKMALKTALDKAKDDPEQLQAILVKIKEAIGM